MFIKYNTSWKCQNNIPMEPSCVSLLFISLTRHRLVAWMIKSLRNLARIVCGLCRISPQVPANHIHSLSLKSYFYSIESLFYHNFLPICLPLIHDNHWTKLTVLEAETCYRVSLVNSLWISWGFVREDLLLYRQLFLYVVDTILPERAQKAVQEATVRYNCNLLFFPRP